MSNKSSTVRGAVEMTAAMLISGTIGWFVVFSGQPITELLFWRCVFGVATLLIVCYFKGSLLGTLTLKQAGWAALGGVAIVLNWLLIFAAFSRASISVAIAVYNTQPFMLVGLGAIFFSERISTTKLAWLGIAFAGVLLIVYARPSAATYAGRTEHLQNASAASGSRRTEERRPDLCTRRPSPRWLGRHPDRGCRNGPSVGPCTGKRLPPAPELSQLLQINFGPIALFVWRSRRAFSYGRTLLS